MNRAKSTFSKPFNEALIRAELIQEMLLADGWTQDEEIKELDPKIMGIFDRHADAALRVMRRIEERENDIRPSEV